MHYGHRVDVLLCLSVALFYSREITHKAPLVSNGLGTPDLQLSLCLLFAWVVVAAILIRGAKSTGKASYFLAIFPYIIMVVLLIQTLMLEGAWTGISFFFTPQWDKLASVEVGCCCAWRLCA